jgi:hypothetical protein
MCFGIFRSEPNVFINLNNILSRPSKTKPTSCHNPLTAPISGNILLLILRRLSFTEVWATRRSYTQPCYPVHVTEISAADKDEEGVGNAEENGWLQNDTARLSSRCLADAPVFPHRPIIVTP